MNSTQKGERGQHASHVCIRVPYPSICILQLFSGRRRLRRDAELPVCFVCTLVCLFEALPLAAAEIAAPRTEFLSYSGSGNSTRFRTALVRGILSLVTTVLAQRILLSHVYTREYVGGIVLRLFCDDGGVRRYAMYPRRE